MYNRVDSQVRSTPKQATPSKGLVGKRGASPDKEVDPVVDYVKYIRELREGKHASN